MYVITDKGVAILLMLISLCLLGTWPALLCLLERRGKKPQHTFLDYSVTNYVVAVIFALTLGNIGNSTEKTPNFATQLSQDNGASVGFAVAGGVFLVMGNMATQYSLAYIGVSLTEVIASSITVVMGTTLNFFLDGRINRAEILFPGVACFLLAVLVGAVTHHSVKKDTEAKLSATAGGVDVEKAQDFKAVNDDDLKAASLDAAVRGDLKAGKNSAEHIRAVENQRSLKVGSASVWLGLSIVTFAGVSYGIFGPAFNISTNDQWHVLPEGVPKLVVYTAFFYFSTGFTGVAWILNAIFLYKPILGAPKSSVTEWIKDNQGRLIALAAGAICGLGNGFQFMAGQAAGYAAADAVQALPLVSTFWGIVLFGEYRRSSRRTYVLLVTMLSLFVRPVFKLATLEVKSSSLDPLSQSPFITSLCTVDSGFVVETRREQTFCGFLLLKGFYRALILKN